MSPVFRHGRLRLYLLKLLDESPRHGYEVIRLLQDRFMGVYAPSPGTIYPRLARLEEEGLVTHEEVDGKKVYSITDKGRAEIRSRLGDLADLEDELTESLREVAKGISEDVRDTVRTIREELASAAREFRAGDSGPGRGSSEAGQSGAASRPAGDEPRTGGDDFRRIREEARRSREQMRASFRARGRGNSEWASWQGWSDRSPWSVWSEWTSGRSEQSEPGGRPGEQQSDTGPGQRTRRGGQNPFGDLERMAMQFATELRAAARQAGDVGERSLSDLRDILSDTLAKVRDEVFTDLGTDQAASDSDSSAATPGSTSPPAPGEDGSPGSADSRDDEVPPQG